MNQDSGTITQTIVTRTIFEYYDWIKCDSGAFSDIKSAGFISVAVCG